MIFYQKYVSLYTNIPWKPGFPHDMVDEEELEECFTLIWLNEYYEQIWSIIRYNDSTQVKLHLRYWQNALSALSISWHFFKHRYFNVNATLNYIILYTNLAIATAVQKRTCARQSEVPASGHLHDLYRWGESHLCQHFQVISAPQTQLTMWVGPTHPQWANTCVQSSNTTPWSKPWSERWDINFIFLCFFLSLTHLALYQHFSLGNMVSPHL